MISDVTCGGESETSCRNLPLLGFFVVYCTLSSGCRCRSWFDMITYILNRRRINSHRHGYSESLFASPRALLDESNPSRLLSTDEEAHTDVEVRSGQGRSKHAEVSRI